MKNSSKTKPEVDQESAKQLTKNPDYQRIVGRIDEEVDYVDIKQYSHNIISLSLQEAAKKFGNAVANDLIEEFGLEDLGWSKVYTDEDI